MDNDRFLKVRKMIRKKAFIPAGGGGGGGSSTTMTPSIARRSNSIAARSSRGVYRSEIKNNVVRQR